MKSKVYSLETVDFNFEGLGGKAINLAKLIQNKFQVPTGFVVTLEAFERGELKLSSISEIEKLINIEKLYAVRSSALAEDSNNESWAGQFESFLNVSAREVIEKVTNCHNSKKSRAIAYGGADQKFKIAVVVQEMVKPDYSGVIFTKNPITGADEMVTEFIEGLGEDLVSGRKDPNQIIIQKNIEICEKSKAPFDLKRLYFIANEIVTVFDGVPQDIEYAIVNGEIYILQSRPITTNIEIDEDIIELGLPEELFFWGPSHAKPKYMSDFFAGIEMFFKKLLSQPNLPKPPVTLSLFHDEKMVWLNRSDEFSRFTHEMFNYYEEKGNINEDIEKWKGFVEKGDLVSAFFTTEMCEFALYGAETEIINRLKRYNIEIRRNIIAAFGTPDKETFLNRIDREIIKVNDHKKMAEKYPWINDGYSGALEIESAEKYFEERIKILNGELQAPLDLDRRRSELLEKYELSIDELKSFELLRKMIEFMDDRKAWMMKSRHEIVNSFASIEHGWYFNGKEFNLISKEETEELYERYVSFKSSTGILKGVVASSGKHHFVSGNVVIVTEPTVSIENGKILVCPMTSPSYVPLMRKAKALITDHGGAMSHAAIVAREFGLPAVVGTKNATKSLKNGDKIMINMITGEIIR